jgi:serine/threonine protein kinase
MPFEEGQLVYKRYRIGTSLGQGGMGKVYRAMDINLNIPVALKEMIPDPHADPETLAKLRQQFKDEAQIVATLDHPNLVRVTNYFSVDQSECLVMNFVEGDSLADRINRYGAQSESQVLAWAQQLLDGLAYCHARNIIHRDIKPQNVVITEEGRPVLVDFGLVKLWDPQDPRTQTVIRAMGTLGYAPPEQYGVLSEHTDPRSDLFSLGATFYHALTGEAPPSATDRIARPETFLPLRSLRPSISPQTEAAILRAMELSITHRFASAEEMAAALRERITVSPVSPVATTMPRQATPGEPSRRRPRWLWGLGGLLFVLLIGAVVGLRGLLPKPADEAPQATIAAVVATPEREPSPEAPSVTATVTSTPLPPTSAPTLTPESTSPSAPTSTATVEVASQPPSNAREAARLAVESFQTARTTAYSTWDTTPYYDVLASDALESSLKVIAQLEAGECRYYITEDAEMQMRYEEESTHRIVVIASRSETQQRVCAGSTEYVCQAFDGRYVVEKMGDRWLITDKSVQNYREVSPCP